MKNKRIYRSKTERMLAGVCGGIAEYLEMDPTIVRLVFVALMFVGGHGLLVYIIAALIMPNKPESVLKQIKEKKEE